MNKIKKIMKMGIIIMTIAMTMAGLTGCNITGKIKEDLKSEYGEEFEIIWLQGSNMGAEYEAYVSPVSNSNILFSIYTDKYGKQKDYSRGGYYEARIWNDIEQKIIEAFVSYGIEASCVVIGDTMADITSLDTTVEEYLVRNQNLKFTTIVVFNENDAMNIETLNKMVKSLEKVNETYVGISINGYFIFYDEEGYSKSKAFIERTVWPSLTVLQGYDAKFSCLNGLKNNKVNSTVEEMFEDFEVNKNVFE